MKSMLRCGGAALVSVLMAAGLPSTVSKAAASPVPTPRVAVASGTQTLSFPANAMALDPVRGTILAVVPSTAGPLLGNRLVEIDSSTGDVLRSVAVGSEPWALAVSDDGSVAWVGLRGAANLVKVDLALFVKIGTFSVLQGGLGTLVIQDIALQPGTTTVVAVSLMMACCGATETLAIYDNGVIRPNRLNAVYQNYDIAFNPDDPSKLYGVDSYTSARDLSIMTVDAQGVVQNSDTWGLAPGNHIEVHGGLIYGDGGVIVDPTGPTVVGSFGGWGSIELVPEYARAYVLDQQGDFVQYDTESLLELSRQPLLPSGTSGYDLIRVHDRFAFLGSSDFSDVQQITLLDPAVSRVSVPVAWSVADTTRLVQMANYLKITPEEVQRNAVGLLAFLVGLSGDGTVTPWTPAPTGTHALFTSDWSFPEASVITTVKSKYAASTSDAHRLSVYLLSFLLGLGGH